jgi:hypothetical protein
MKYLRMFFASLQMARTLDNKQVARDSQRVTAMIDELCPKDVPGRPATAHTCTVTDPRTAPRAA